MPLVWVFAGGLHRPVDGELNFFNLKSKLNSFHLVSGVPLGSDFLRFLQQWKEDTLEQLLHSCAGGPGEFRFDLIEGSFDISDLPLDLLADVPEVDALVAVVVLFEEVGLVVSAGH